MTGNGRTFVIAGAGIAGLTLALSLAKFGAHVIVLERAPRLQEFGAGLQIGPNARRILDRLGVGRLLAPKSFNPEALDLYPFRSARPAISIPLGETVLRDYGIPYAVAHRADLATSLHQACKRFASIDILFGVKSVHVTRHARGTTVMVDEADAKSRTIRPFAYIGADGVHSSTRTELLSGNDAVYTGYVAWRALLPLNLLDGVINLNHTSVLLGPGFHAVLYPLPHRDQLNVAAFSRHPASPSDQNNVAGPIKLPNSAKKSLQFMALQEAANNSWTRWPLYGVSARDWHAGAIGLIGDAAHAMLPFQAQGAAMAIEDAAVLAPLLMTEPNGASALQRYEAARKPRVARVARVSARNGRIFHLPAPFSTARDLAFHLGVGKNQIRRLDWLYRYDPSPEVPTRTSTLA